MGVWTKATLITKHLQYVGLVKKLGVDLPDTYFSWVSFSDLINLDWSFINIVLPDLPIITFRVQFITACILLPLVVMILTLLAFVRFVWIIWAVMAVLGVVILLIRVVAVTQNEDLLPEGFAANTNKSIFTMTAVAMLVVCIYFIAVPKIAKRMANPTVRDIVLRLRVMLEPAGLCCGAIVFRLPEVAVKVLATLSALYLTVVLFRQGMEKRPLGVVAGMMVVTVALIWAKASFSPAVMPDQTELFGLTLMVLSVLGCILQMLTADSTSKAGQIVTKFRNKFQSVMDKGLLTVCFFFLSMALVPVTTNCLQMFMCVQFTCPKGKRFNPFAPVLVEDQFDTSESRFCDACNVSSTACGYKPDDLCPPYSEYRLLHHPETVCDSKTHPLFITSAVLIVIVFVVCISLMFGAIIREIAKSLISETKVTLQKMMDHHKEAIRSYEEQKMIYDFKRERSDIRKRSNSKKGAKMDAGTKLSNLRDVSDDDILGLGPPHARAGAEALELSDIELEETSSPARGQPPPLPAIDSADGDTPQPDGAAPPSPGAEATEKALAGIAIRPTAPSHTPTFDDAFAEVCARVTPKASSLYSPYRFPMRYFLMMDNIHRILLVLVSVVLSPLLNIGGILNLIFHGLLVVFLIYFRPYNDSREQGLCLVIAICDSINGLYVSLLWAMPSNKTLQDPILIIVVLVVTMIMPVTLAVVLQVVSFYTSWSNPYKRAAREKLKKEKQERQKKQDDLLKQIDVEINVAKELGEDVSKNKSVAEMRRKILEERRQSALSREEIATERLNKMTKTTMLRYFLFICVPVLVVAAVLTSFAFIRSNYDDYRVGSDSLLRSDTYVLGGESTWGNFTDHCCCFQTAHPMSGFALTERWVCAADGAPHNINTSQRIRPGVTVSKNRKASKGHDDGTLIRPLCGTQIPAECQVVVESGAVSLKCIPDNYLLNTLNATLTASTLLW